MRQTQIPVCCIKSLCRLVVVEIYNYFQQYFCFFSYGPPSLTQYLYSPELTIFAHLDYQSTKAQLFLLCFHQRFGILNRKGILIAAAPLQNIVLYLTRFHVSVEIESVEFVWIFMAVTEIRIQSQVSLGFSKPYNISYLNAFLLQQFLLAIISHKVISCLDFSQKFLLAQAHDFLHKSPVQTEVVNPCSQSLGAKANKGFEDLMQDKAVLSSTG